MSGWVLETENIKFLHWLVLKFSTSLSLHVVLHIKQVMVFEGNRCWQDILAGISLTGKSLLMLLSFFNHIEL